MVPMIAMMLWAVTAQALERTDLPSVEDLAFPTLYGDFDGDGVADRARARQGDRGVEIAMDLSTTQQTYIEALGADDLSLVVWEVLDGRTTLARCGDPIDCPSAVDKGADRDSILVTVGDEQFVLRWDGEALETLFLDA